MTAGLVHNLLYAFFPCSQSVSVYPDAVYMNGYLAICHIGKHGGHIHLIYRWDARPPGAQVACLSSISGVYRSKHSESHPIVK